MRRSSFPPELQKFVESVEENAEEAGHSRAGARIIGAWSACFVRFCTVNDRGWREPDHVPGFLDYLEERQDVDEASRERAAEAMVFLFEDLLKTDVSGARWHPKRQAAQTEEAVSDDGETTDEGDDVEGEQSTLLTRLLFHTSLPINEALELCAGDVDLDAGLIYVSDPMGTPKRIIELPDTLYDPLRRHLQRLRDEHGPRYFDASLFQARAIQGRVDESSSGSEDEPERVPADSPEDADAGDGPASLWGYAAEDS